MTDVAKREETQPDKRHDDRPGRLDVFDRLFGDWMPAMPFRRVFEPWDEGREQMIRVDQFEENGELVVRADLPGVDPDKDVEVTVAGDVLRIHAERRQEEKTEDRGYVRNELRYGSFRRTLPLPQGVSSDDVRATYKDGILEVRLPLAAPAPATKVQVAKA